MTTSLARERWIRLLLVLLGAWLALSVAMGWVASANFKVVEPDRLRDAASIFAQLPEGEPRRMKLRYIASEMNRHDFAAYDKVNLALAVLAVLVAARLSQRPRGAMLVLLLCLAMAVVFTTWFTPTLIAQGRQIDFVARDPRPPEVAAFYRLHGVNIGLELLKMLLITSVIVRFVRQPPR